MSLIGKQVGNYVIKAKLGEGGMGAVYLGEHPLIGKRVAVKVLLEELAAKEDIVTRFFHEAKAVNDIGHQNIVDIQDYGKMKNDAGTDIVYFVMEFLDGESLSARLRRTGMAFNETLHVMSQCCSALAASHSKGIVHRDLKPENIYLCTRGSDKNFTKILDFGIAKLTGEGGSSSHKTRTGLVIGTPTYMSPEQCEGKGLIDARSDIYSLGVVMYELLTGRVPFPGEGFGEILVAHLTKDPEPLSALNPDVTPELESIVMHAIEKDRTKRFQTMDEFEAAVMDVSGHFAAYKPMTGAMPVAMPGANSAGIALGATVTGQNTGAPRPTTLSGSATEMGAVPAGKSRMPLFAGLGAAVLAIGAAVLITTNNKPSKQAAQQQQPIAEQVPAPKPPAPIDTTVVVAFTTDPPGAEVKQGGAMLGTTPLKIDTKKGDAPFQVTISKAGFQPMVAVVSASNPVVTIPLAAVPVATPVATPVSHHTSGGSGSGKPRKPDKPQNGDDMSLLRPSWDH